MKGLDFETRFTQQEYKSFAASVSARKEYEFQLGDRKSKMNVTISGRECNNGVWSPENYYWTISIQDNRNGFYGCSHSFRVNEMLSYEEIVEKVYKAFKLEMPKTQQLSFL